jgi:hypothetical protein
MDVERLSQIARNLFDSAKGSLWAGLRRWAGGS